MNRWAGEETEKEEEREEEEEWIGEETGATPDSHQKSPNSH
jgi:hypothetical protein